jgi:hypothetical protein
VWPADCLNVGESDLERCSYGDPGSPRSVAVLGDSFAAAWVPALRERMVPAGWFLQSLTFGVCPNITATPVFADEAFTACTVHREWAIEHILADPPSLVVLSHSWHADLVDEPDRSGAYRQGLIDVVRRIQASGAEVVVLGAPPGARNLQLCATNLNGPDDCLRGPADEFAEQTESEQQVAAATGVRAISTEQWFCVDGLCPTVVGGTPVYFDGSHLTAEYARRIAPEVVTAILRP